MVNWYYWVLLLKNFDQRLFDFNLCMITIRGDKLFPAPFDKLLYIPSQCRLKQQVSFFLSNLPFSSAFWYYWVLLLKNFDKRLFDFNLCMITIRGGKSFPAPFDKPLYIPSQCRLKQQVSFFLSNLPFSSASEDL